MKEVTIYTDGSWKKQKQSGGWACLLVCWPYWKVVTGQVSHTTINRMELTAVIRSLQELTEKCHVTIISDSAYTVQCISKWMYGWERNNWRTSTGDPVINQDLLKELKQLLEHHHVEARWIPSHTNRTGVDFRGNACVDAFAQMSSDGVL